jgi:cell division protein FtsI (penicillin-binding protein 3)
MVRDYKKWPQVAVGTISFGQGVSVTPLQLVTALSAIANRGALPKPYIVESIVRPGGAEVFYHSPETRAQVISAETARIVTGFMKAVVAPGATGALAQVEGYPVAGKTGTAQKAMENARGYADGKYVCSFMGFLPADRPVLAMIVVLDEPDMENPYGGTLAAPIFQAIAKQAMVLLKVPAETETAAIAQQDVPPAAPGDEGRQKRWRETVDWNAAPKTPAYTGAMVMPDLTGLAGRRAVAALKGKPVQIQIVGSGLVVSQSPAPGSPLGEGTVVRIRLEPAP